MSEREKPPEVEGREKSTRQPNLLDVVKIDGRWAQVVFTGDYVKYLNDGVSSKINWEEFRLVRDWDQLPVSHVKRFASFTANELQNIHWGPQQAQTPFLKEHVSVFGEYEKINNK